MHESIQINCSSDVRQIAVYSLQQSALDMMLCTLILLTNAQGENMNFIFLCMVKTLFYE